MEKTVKTYTYDDELILGEGGFAKVFYARGGRPESEVALKILKREFEADDRVVSSFFRDPELMRTMSHDNIIRIQDVGNAAEKPYYLTMEYCSGGDLKNMIGRKHRLPFRLALQTTIAVCKALTYCHDRGILHRDVKASNILFRDEDSPVLSDFGAPVEEDVLRGQKVPQIGSPPYLPPEVWTGREYDARSDLYSLGVVLYYALTGKLPFSANSPEEFRELHLRATPALASSSRPGVVRSLDEVVRALLEKEPSNRVQTAESLRHRLEEIVSGAYSKDASPKPLKVVLYDRPHQKTGLQITRFPFRIGKQSPGVSDEQNDLVIGSDDPFVSRVHAVVERIDDSFFFTDVSTNGSTVNGVRIHKQTVELSTQNEIHLGANTDFAVQVVPDEGAPEGGAGSETSLMEPSVVGDRAWDVSRVVPVAVIVLSACVLLLMSHLSCT